jgi:hypothetical protein
MSRQLRLYALVGLIICTGQAAIDVGQLTGHLNRTDQTSFAVRLNACNCGWHLLRALLDQFCAVGAQAGGLLEAHPDHAVYVGGVTTGEVGHGALANFAKKLLHVTPAEGRVKRAHLEENAADAPNVALQVVGFVVPDLGAGVVGSSSLRFEQSLFGNLGNIEIAEF